MSDWYIINSSRIFVRTDIPDTPEGKNKECPISVPDYDMFVVLKSNNRIVNIIFDAHIFIVGTAPQDNLFIKPTNYCWFWSGDSDGWMNFPWEFDSMWDALFIEVSKLPSDIDNVIIGLASFDGYFRKGQRIEFGASLSGVPFYLLHTTEKQIMDYKIKLDNVEVSKNVQVIEIFTLEKTNSMWKLRILDNQFEVFDKYFNSL